MIRLTLPLLAFALSGCATSLAGLGDSPPETVFDAPRTPMQISQCLALEYKGGAQIIEGANGSFIVSRSNAYGVPITRIDLIPIEAGTRVEFRSSISIGAGVSKARECGGLADE